jgi:hypothetical protein
MCSYSWRVPLTAGVGPLRIVASQDLGAFGQVESEPVVVPWRWYYHFPLGILWVPLALLLFGVKENRKWRAWLILVAIFAVMIFWGMLVRLFQLQADQAEPTTLLFGALAMGWASVWLLAPWLARRRWFVGLLLALGTMLVMGVLAYGVNYGIVRTGEPPIFLISYGAASFALVLAMALSGLCCRRHGRPALFMVWLFLWTLLGGGAGLLVLSVPVLMVMSGSGGEAIGMLVMAVVSSLIVGGFFGVAIYLTNVPFMILAFRNSLYRGRLYGVLGIPAVATAGASPFAEGAPLSKQPASELPTPGTADEETVADPAATEHVEHPGASPVA